ncbi:MAG: endo-1,4-beta-xylanase [Candidatus Azobacteroides sp.]|nr:endo-1,4-beta-xylanase [Candidatus Azobacteroides sp.]
MNMKIKIKNILSLILLAGVVSLNSCYDEKMEWGDTYTHPATTAELPLALKEAISRYEVLKNYTDFTLGAGIDFTLYQNNAAYSDIVNKNFTEITPGNEMKHYSVVDNKGALNFTLLDKVFPMLKASGLTVYGHTLVWHQNQNATYLNGLIAPTIIPGTPGSSLILNGDFESGLDGWDIPYYKEVVSVTTDEAIDGTHSMKVEVGDFGKGKYDMQINSPAFSIIKGHRYEISFFIKSEGAGAVGLDFPNTDLTNQYPYTDGKELAPTSAVWTKVTYNPTFTPDGMVAKADNSAITFRLLLGAVANMTYYIDGVEVIDLDASAGAFNYVENGDFETGDLAPWTAPNPGAGITVTTAAKFEGSYGLQAIASSTSDNDYKLQFQSSSMNLDPLTTYTLSFQIKSDVAGSGRISFPGNPAGVWSSDNPKNEYPFMDWEGTGTATRVFTTSPSWKTISVDITNAATIQLSFDLGLLPDVTYFVDDVKLVDKQPATAQARKLRAGPISIEKTPEEKAEIIGTALESWISQMVTHCKPYVHAWDVVNEPMDDSGSLRTGEENLQSTDIFYWQYYLGKDYAVTAFKTARAADPAAKLFINDYNLEYNLSKCDGLIDYVKYIESQGAQVDGIGTQMHLSLDSDTSKIVAMFQKLAATKKLIKVSELDIAIGTNSPTLDQYAQQAALYQYVVDAFKQYVPANQRYGITVWGVSDNADEHTYWLPDDAPCLWDANYERKHAYKGFADGLAGKDISADFPGDLIY